jgi:hypothetical protein
MSERWLMKFFVFTFILFALNLSAQAVNLRGYLYVVDGKYSFIDGQTLSLTPLRPKSLEIQDALHRLSSFDSITGTASISSENDLILESLDFVSLQRLIGTWQDGDKTVHFVNYTQVQVISPTETLEYTYVLSPCADATWCMYLSDSQSVVIGSLTFIGNQVQILLYDSMTGEISQTFNLQKTKTN